MDEVDLVQINGMIDDKIESDEAPRKMPLKDATTGRFGAEGGERICFK